jgi:hypothetical protein
MLKSLSALQRNALGQVLANHVGVAASWPDDGPFPVLRDIAFGRAPSTLTDGQRLVLRVAFDIYDGTGGNVSFVELVDGLAGDFVLLGLMGQVMLALIDGDGAAAFLKAHGIEADESVDAERAALLSRGTLQ